MVNRKAPIVEFLGMYQKYYIQIIIYWTLLFDTFSEEHVLLKNELEYRSLLFQKFLKIHGCAKFLFLEFNCKKSINFESKPIKPRILPKNERKHVA